MDDILLVGDFNACTANRQVCVPDMSEDIFRELATEDLGIEKTSQDTAAFTKYVEYLLEMGGAHGQPYLMILLDGHYQEPSHATLWYGISTVDYVLAPISHIPRIHNLTISHCLISVVVDHAILSFKVDCQYSTQPSIPRGPQPFHQRDGTCIHERLLSL